MTRHLDEIDLRDLAQATVSDDADCHALPDSVTLAAIQPFGWTRRARECLERLLAGSGGKIGGG